jgi:hypothetical protein
VAVPVTVTRRARTRGIDSGQQRTFARSWGRESRAILLVKRRLASSKLKSTNQITLSYLRGAGGRPRHASKAAAAAQAALLSTAALVAVVVAARVSWRSLSAPLSSI